MNTIPCFCWLAGTAQKLRTITQSKPRSTPPPVLLFLVLFLPFATVFYFDRLSGNKKVHQHLDAGSRRVPLLPRGHERLVQQRGWRRSRRRRRHRRGFLDWNKRSGGGRSSPSPSGASGSNNRSSSSSSHGDTSSSLAPFRTGGSWPWSGGCAFDDRGLCCCWRRRCRSRAPRSHGRGRRGLAFVRHARTQACRHVEVQESPLVWFEVLGARAPLVLSVFSANMLLA